MYRSAHASRRNRCAIFESVMRDSLATDCGRSATSGARHRTSNGSWPILFAVRFGIQIHKFTHQRPSAAAVQAAFNDVKSAQQEKQTGLTRPVVIKMLFRARRPGKRGRETAEAYAFRRVNEAKRGAKSFPLLSPSIAKPGGDAAPSLSRGNAAIPAKLQKKIHLSSLKNILQKLAASAARRMKELAMNV